MITYLLVTTIDRVDLMLDGVETPHYMLDFPRYGHSIKDDGSPVLRRLVEEYNSIMAELQHMCDAGEIKSTVHHTTGFPVVTYSNIPLIHRWNLELMWRLVEYPYEST